MRQDQFPMGDHFVQAVSLHAVDHFPGGKGALAGGTPDIDPSGVDHQQPGVEAAQLVAQGVEGKFVVGAHQYG